MFTPVSGLFSSSNPVAQGQLTAPTPQQLLEEVQRDKIAADWHKSRSQADEAELHYKAAQELLEEVMKTTSIDSQTSKAFESIYLELLKARGRTAEAEILEQKGRVLLERYGASSASSRKREVERGSSSEHLTKKNYAAIPGLRSEQRAQDTVLSNGAHSALIPLQQPVALLTEKKTRR